MTDRREAGALRKPVVEVLSIEPGDVDDVARFLHEHLNERVPIAAWVGLMTPSWLPSPSNCGFRLHVDGALVGAYVAVHSQRRIAGVDTAVCNLAAFCVLPEHRAHSLRLLRAMLAQKDVVFTDLSPSGAVPAMNERLGFRHLDATTRVTANLPGVVGGVSLSSEAAQFESTLTGTDAVVYTDHRDAAAARHILVRSGGGYAYLVYRRDRRRRLPLFATPLYAGGDIDLLRRAWPAVAGHLLRRGLPFTLAEPRILGFVPRGPGRVLAHPRPRMHRGEPAPADHLYSELALLPW